MEGEHVHGHIFVDGGDFRAQQQRQTDFLRGFRRLAPAGGGVMVGNRHTMQAKLLACSTSVRSVSVPSEKTVWQ